MPTANKIYLDANFLIAYFANNHTDHNASKKAFYELLKTNSELYISTLCLDETWYKIWEIPFREKKLKKKHWSDIKDFYPNIKLIIEELKKLPDTFKLIQFENDLKEGINNASENIGNYSLEPRDAFHLAYMQDLGINQIITKDKKFDHVSDITVISF